MNRLSVSKELLSKVFLNGIVFYLANIAYPNVFNVVGYMYNFQLNFSLTSSIVAILATWFLTIATYSKDISQQHTFDLMVLGIYLPIATVVVQVGLNLIFIIYPFLSILIIRILVSSLQNKDKTSVLNTGHELSGIRNFVFVSIFVLLLLIILYFLSKYSSSLSYNLLDTYVRTYEIREDNQASGLLGYVLGWFVLVFFPFMFSFHSKRVRRISYFLAFLGAFLVFQLFARKLIIFNSILLFLFSFSFSRGGLLQRYFPQLFFIAILSLPWFVRFPIEPLVDRFFYLIGVNSIYYFDFFSEHSHRFFEGTKISFGWSNYNMDVGYQIDNVYYQGLGVNQSAGFLPTIYADLGLVGLVFGSVLVGLIISSIRYIGIMDFRLSYLLGVAFTFSLMNHSLNMLFLSNGLVFILFLSLMLKLLELSFKTMRTKRSNKLAIAV